MRTVDFLLVGTLALGVGGAARAAALPAQATGSAEAGSKEQTKDTTVKVKPGESGSNGDVTVVNTSEKADAKIEGPKYPNSTKVTTEKDFTGTISGVDTGDTVDLGLSQDGVLIEATGGTVLMKKGSSVTVTVSGPNASPVVVEMPGGSSLTIDPGSSVTLKTK